MLSDGTHDYLYGPSTFAGQDALLGQVNGTQTQYFLGDALGSVRQVTDAAGVVSQAKSYDPYGQVLSDLMSAGTQPSSFGYTGQITDPGGLVDLRARYITPVGGYDPGMGRFTSLDSDEGNIALPQTLNRYAYAGDNPALYRDPGGHCISGGLDTAACGGALLFGAMDIYSQLDQNGGHWQCINWGEVGKFAVVGAVVGVSFLLASVGLISIPGFMMSMGFMGWDIAHGNTDALLMDAAFGMIPDMGPLLEGGQEVGRSYINADEAYKAFLAAQNSGEYVDLYHATSSAGAANIWKIGIDPSYTKPPVDFGVAFYTTIDQAQAWDWAVQRFGDDAAVLHFKVPKADLEALNGYSFRGTSENWLDFVTRNRLQQPIPPRYASYDLISGKMLLNPKEYFASTDHLADYRDGIMSSKVGDYLQGQGVIEAAGQQTAFYSKQAFEILRASLVP